MQKEIYEKNLEVLRQKFPDWAKLMESDHEPEQKTDRESGEAPVLAKQVDDRNSGEAPVLTDRKDTQKSEEAPVLIRTAESISGETILTAQKDGRLYYLEGKYAPTHAIEHWLEKNKPFSEFSTIFVIGIHNGMHLRILREHLPQKTKLLIYEPSLDIFRTAFENVDLSFLFEPDIPVGIVVEGINEKELEIYYQNMINFDNMTLLKTYVSGNYSRLFENLVKKAVKKLHKYIQDIKIQWNTTARYTSVNAKNVFTNIKYLYKNSAINSLYHILPEDMPTIVVSAGPSLNKNIMELKKAEGKACIIATDTAMKPLLNAGIRPNLFVIVDGLKPGLLFEHPDISKVPMVTYTVVAEKPMKIHKGKKFFTYSGSALENELIATLARNGHPGKAIAYLPTGGSVANNCFTLGMYMGSKTIILVGQDLAFTNNRTHADGTFQDKMDEIDTEAAGYFEVEANDGGKVLTRGDFNHYRKWFEDRIEEWSHIRVINATEGGAKIKGAEVMTLAEAIEETCHTEKNLHWHISHAKKYLQSEEEKKIMLDYLFSIPDKVQEVRKKAEDGIKHYEKLLKLSQKKNYSPQQLQKTLKKISNINKYMETDYMALMMSESLKGVEYTLRATLFETKNTEREEIRDIAQHGLVMLRSIINVSVQFEKLAENTVVKFAKHHTKKQINPKNRTIPKNRINPKSRTNPKSQINPKNRTISANGKYKEDLIT